MGLHDRTFKISASEPTMETATLVHARHLVREFLVYLKANPIEDMTLVNIDRLPLPKATLTNAFRLLIAGEKRLEQRAQLQKVGLLLAQFQSVGNEPVPAGSDAGENDPLESFIDTLASDPVSQEQSWLAASREQEELIQLFDMSARLAERSHGNSPADVDGERRDGVLPN